MKEPTIEEISKLVTFGRDANGTLYLIGVRGSVRGNVEGNVRGNVGGDVSGYVAGNVWGNVCGFVGEDVGASVLGNVCGSVLGTIHGRKWQLVETPKEKAIRLIEEGKGDEAIQVLRESE
jgi:hypothetical protein